MSAPSSIRLVHPKAPEGREFTEHRVRLMRRRGWTDPAPKRRKAKPTSEPVTPPPAATTNEEPSDG